MIELRAFTDADIKAHNSGEDDETVRWLAGRAGTVDSTRPHFAMLADNASRGAGKRGFAIRLDRPVGAFHGAHMPLTRGARFDLARLDP